MRRMIALALATLATPAGAHPHIFIDTGIEVIFDAEGRAAKVRVTWAYDDFYSMVMIEDRKLDADHDGVLTPAEEAALSGFDMGWDADYEGDLFVLVGADQVPVHLGRPSDWTARVEGGRIISTHVRAFDVAVARGAPVVIQVYDPGYYSAYRIDGVPLLTGAPEGCLAEVFEPDLDAASEALQAAVAEYTADQSLEQDFPAVGASFADEVRVTCPGA